MSFLAAVEASAFFTWLRESDSIGAFPTVLMLHTLGVMALGGACAALDLRILGIGLGIPLASLRRLFPIMWASFSLNLVTGIMLFCAYATSLAVMPMFFIKLALVGAGVATIVVLQRGVRHDPTAPAPTALRTVAAASLIIWTAVIMAGRLLAYIE